MTTYADLETSTYGGKPLELYLFVCGTLRRAYSSGDVAVTYNGDTYNPDTISRSQVDQSNEQLAGSIEITVPRDNDIAAFYIAYLPITPVQITVYRQHRGVSEYITVLDGNIIGVKFNGSEAVMTCAPISNALQRKIPTNNYEPNCNHDLYGVGCGINKNSFRQTLPVSAVSGTAITIPGVSIHPDNWYQTGWIERTTGEKRFITSHTGNMVTVLNQFVGLEVGETVSVYAGCDHTDSTCLSKFNNLVNFLGFTRVGGRNPFDGSIN